MSHFSPEDWADFIRGLRDSQVSAVQQRHLDRNCRDCHVESEFWKTVHTSAEREPGYEPPASAVTFVKKAYSADKLWAKLVNAAQMAMLVFDSALMPSPALVRGPGLAARHLLHEAEPFVIDLRVESNPARKHISLTGQVLDSKNPGREMTDVDVILLNGDNLVARTSANGSGEFDLGFSQEEHLRLFINIRGRRAIGIVLPTAGVN